MEVVEREGHAADRGQGQEDQVRQHPGAGHVSEQPGLRLGDTFRAPDEAGVAEERAVLVEVAVLSLIHI